MKVINSRTAVAIVQLTMNHPDTSSDYEYFTLDYDIHEDSIGLIFEACLERAKKNPYFHTFTARITECYLGSTRIFETSEFGKYSDIEEFEVKRLHHFTI